ncbi:hypothetical protein Tco_1106686 [Tanacetum coccineum]
MAQHVIPAAQLVSQYKPIRICNNYVVLQSIPCSPECKIDGEQDTLQLPVKTPENSFVAPANIHTIKAFMNRVGYQGVVDKVSAFFTKNLAQPWQTMFKVVNRCLTTRTSGHDQTKINILQLFHVVINRTHVDYVALIWWDFMNNMFQKKEAIQYPRFTKLIIVDLMKKFPNIPKRIEEDYHSIKDDIPLIRETDDFKEYEMVFMKKRRQTARESSSLRKSLKITIKKRQTVEKDNDDSEDRIKPRSHKDNPKFIDDDDDKAEEKNSDDMGSLEIRNEETQTTIPIPLSALRRMCRRQANIIIEDHDSFRSEVPAFVSQEFNAHAPAIIEELFKNYVQSNVVHVHPTTTTSTKTESSATLQYQLEDYFHSQHDEHQDDDAPPEGEKIVKKIRGHKDQSLQEVLCQKWDAWEEENVIDEDEVIPEDETPELIAEFQDVDKRVPTIFDRARMEATLRDSLSNQSRNAEEYAYHLEQSTNFMENQIVWESSQQDIPRTIPKTLIFYGPQRNLNEPPRYLYNKDLFFLKYGNTEEMKYILSLYKIHTEEFPEPDLEEKLNQWVRKVFKIFNEDARITEVVRIITYQPHGLDFMEQILVIRANDKPDSFSEADFKYLNKNDIEDLYYLYQSKEINNQKIKLMNSLITFIRSCVIWERVYDFHLGIKSYQMKVNLTAPILTLPGIKEHAPYSIVKEPQTCLIYLNGQDEKRVMYLVEIVKFCDATLEKVLNEVKLRMFESRMLKKPPLLIRKSS